jgi:hypothetical protein
MMASDEAVQVQAFGVQQIQSAVVTIKRGSLGAHVGIRYRADDDGNWNHAHLEFHHKFKVEEHIDNDVGWITQSLTEDELSDVATIVRLVARRYIEGRIPYAFGLDGQHLQDDGSIVLGHRLGLTCATFVLLLFRHAHIELVQTSSWDERTPERRVEDVHAHEFLLKHLRRRDSDHARNVEAQGVDVVRIRAEEVAAASGLAPHPVPFARAERVGKALLSQLK